MYSKSRKNAPERLDFKLNLISNIDARTRHDVVIASSSSGIPSSQFVTGCKKNPARVLIGHPFNPPHLVPLVEVVPHPGTDAKYTSVAMKFYSSLNKNPVLVRQECPGFIANRLQAALCNEAYSLVNRGIISAEDLGQYKFTSFSLSITVKTYRLTIARFYCYFWTWTSLGYHRTVYDERPRWGWWK